jgi:hypothetical protein
MKDGQSSSPQVNAFHEVKHFCQFFVHSFVVLVIPRDLTTTWSGFTACYKIRAKSHALAKTIIGGFANFEEKHCKFAPWGYAKQKTPDFESQEKIKESGCKLAYMKTKHICRMKLICLTLS